MIKFLFITAGIFFSQHSFAQQAVKIIDGNGGTQAAGVTATGLQVDIGNSEITISSQSIYPAGSFFSSNSVVSTSATTFAAPAHAVGFILEAEGGNTDNVRWAVGSVASTSVGVLTEPGRDSGYIPLAADISVSSLTGTQSVDVQWVLSQ
jgi:hypothetical protein